MTKNFIHLRTQSSYSLSESTLKIKKLVSMAKEKNMPALAITDNNNMFGVFEFAQECSQNKIQPIIGSSINLLDIKHNDKISQISFLVKNEIGYKNLLHLSSLSHLSKNSEVGLYLKDLENYSEGLFCFLGGEYNPLMFLNLQGKDKIQTKLILSLKNLFNNNLLFELQRIQDPLIDEFENQFILLANEYEIPLIGSNNIKFGEAEDFLAHDALLCVSQKSTVNNTNRIQSNPELYFKDSKEMNTIFEDYPEIIENNISVAIACNFFPKETSAKLPKFVNDFNLTEDKLLIKLSKEGLESKLIDIKKSNHKQYNERWQG